jgi:hypothetical protein
MHATQSTHPFCVPLERAHSRKRAFCARNAVTLLANTQSEKLRIDLPTRGKAGSPQPKSRAPKKIVARQKVSGPASESKRSQP